LFRNRTKAAESSQGITSGEFLSKIRNSNQRETALCDLRSWSRPSSPQKQRIGGVDEELQSELKSEMEALPENVVTARVVTSVADLAKSGRRKTDVTLKYEAEVGVRRAELKTQLEKELIHGKEIPASIEPTKLCSGSS